jgi:hypothetical protein
MVVLSLGKWSTSAGMFFVRERIYLKGRWTPFCRIKKRYATWFGYFKNREERG